MKKRIFSIILCGFLLILFIIFNISLNKSKTFKILKVIEADKFYVDFNNDNITDSDELVKLSDITAFSPIKNSYTVNVSNEIGIDIVDYMKNGYLARSWAKDNLENKYIELTDKKIQYTKFNKYIFIKAKLNNKDLAQTLLENGLAFTYKNCDSYDYFQAQNHKTIGENISAVDKLQFSILNKTTNVIHKISCEFKDKIYHAELILTRDLHKFNFKKCKHCNNVIDKVINNGLDLESKRTYKKSVRKKFGEIEIFLINPLEFNKPSLTCRTDICKVIVSEINSAETSIDVALYGFSSQNDILNALIRAKERGVKLRVVMDYSKNNEIYKDSKLFGEKFGAVVDKTEVLMHNKFFIFDDKKVLTGSMNISSSGSGGYNANIVALINSAELAKIYKTEFSQMYDGKFQNNKRKIVSSPVKLNGSTVTPYFSPKSDVYKNAILPLIKNAKNEIFVSIFYLTDKRLVDELVEARKRGVRVAILWDSLGAINFKNLFNDVRKNKIFVKAENWGGKNHEKTLLADNKLLIGSSNFSSSGFNKNDENVIIIENNEIAEFYRDYFIYLFNSIDNKYSEFIPRAESFESLNSCSDGIDNNFDGFIDGADDGCKVKK